MKTCRCLLTILKIYGLSQVAYVCNDCKAFFIEIYPVALPELYQGFDTPCVNEVRTMLQHPGYRGKGMIPGIKHRFAGCVIVLMILCGCGQHPKIDVTANVENGKVVFDIPYSDINGLLGFAVTDEAGKAYWIMSLPYVKANQIVYGEFPPVDDYRSTSSIHQTSPAEGQEFLDIRGKEVNVEVQYQYDEPFAACVGSFKKRIVIPNE